MSSTDGDTGITAAREVLIDGFTRVDEAVEALTSSASEAVMRWRADPEANTIAWLIWHSARVQDDHVTDLSGGEQVWPQWRDRFDLPFDDWATGYGQSPEDAGKVPGDAHALAGYHHAVHEQTLAYLRSITADELSRVVDENWDPPVTASARLVSVINDATQHLGQAAYVAGLADHAGIS